MSQIALEPTGTFGAYLRFLRRRARLTQTELGIAVGYSHGQISMLESGQRAPDVTAVMALFVGALGVQGDKQAAGTLVELARTAPPSQGRFTAERPPQPVAQVQQQQWQQTDLGLLEGVPPLPSGYVPRAQALQRLEQLIQRERRVAICGLAGMGKSTLAAAYAHGYARRHPVFWFTCGDSATMPAELLRQLALFVLAYGGATLAAPTLVSRIAAGEAPGPVRQQALCSPGRSASCAPRCWSSTRPISLPVTTAARPAPSMATLAPYSRHLFVTREWLDLEDLPHFMVGGLEPEEALALCTALTGGGSRQIGCSAQTGISERSLDQIYAHTAGSPLLMRLAVSRLEQETQSLPAIVGAMVAGQLVHSLVAPLSPAARFLLDFLAIWPSPVNLSDHGLAARLAEGRLTTITARPWTSCAAHGSSTMWPTPRSTPCWARRSWSCSLANRRQQLLHRLAAQWAISQGNPVEAARHSGRRWGSCQGGDAAGRR